jgi:hypothetical protein
MTQFQMFRNIRSAKSRTLSQADEVIEQSGGCPFLAHSGHANRRRLMSAFPGKADMA